MKKMIFWLKQNKGEVVVFGVSMILIAVYNLVTAGKFYVETPDGNLYLSVARNFIRSGHFIQDARPYEQGMIVPAGLPIVCLLCLAITGSVYSIVILQYILFGMTAILLMKAVTEICSGGGMVKYVVPIFFLWVSIRLGAPNPSTVLTETYVVFFTTLLLWIVINNKLVLEKKMTISLIILIVILFIRPACSGLVALGFITAIVLVFKKKIRFRILFLYLMILGLLLGGNAILNYRETGKPVLLENYGAIAVYQANNYQTQTNWYDSSKAEDFSEPEYYKVIQDETLTMNEKNQILSARTKMYISKEPISVIKNAMVKYAKLFIISLGMEFYLAFIALGILRWKKKLSKGQSLLILVGFLISSIVPAFGLLMLRYAVPVIPFYIVVNGALVCYVSELLRTSTGIQEKRNG